MSQRVDVDLGDDGLDASSQVPNTLFFFRVVLDDVSQDLFLKDHLVFEIIGLEDIRKQEVVADLELVVVLETLGVNHIHPILEDLIDLAFFVVGEDKQCLGQRFYSYYRNT